MKKSIKYFFGFVFVVVFLGLLSKIFSGQWVLPQVFHIGFLTIHYYGLCMAAAIAVGYWLAQKRAGRFGLNAPQADTLLFWVVISGFLGARAYHVLSDIGYYAQYPADMFKIWQGGLSIYGAVLGGLVCLLLCRKIYKLKILNLLDWLAPAVLVGQIIGRLGNLFNYEAYGYPTVLPWGMYVPEQFRPEAFAGRDYFHPWFLYEMLWNGLVLAGLLALGQRKKLNSGMLFLAYVLLYNIGRFFLEFMRIDSTWLGPLRLNAAVSCALVFLALGGFLTLASKHAQVP